MTHECEIRCVVAAPGELLRKPPLPDHPVWIQRLPEYHEFYCICVIAGRRADVQAFIADRGISPEYSGDLHAEP